MALKTPILKNNKNKKNDKTAERQSFTLKKEIFKEYKNYIKDHPEYNVSHKLYCNIIKDFYEAIIKAIVTEGLKFSFLSDIGNIYLTKGSNSNYSAIDFQKTKEYGVKIYHTNHHTMGTYYKIKWHKSTLRNLRYYYFVPTHCNKQFIKNSILDDNVKVNR